MQEFRVTGRLMRFGPGARIGMSPAQAKVRAHNLVLVEDGEAMRVMGAINPVEFKQGETVWLDEHPGKAFAETLAQVGEAAMPDASTDAPAAETKRAPKGRKK